MDGSKMNAEIPPSRLLEQIVGDALERRATDIHLENVPDALAVSFRLDGRLKHVGEVGAPAGHVPVERSFSKKN